MGIGGAFFNFIGGTIRFVYGSIWRTLANKPKFKYSEYLNGPENSDDWLDETALGFNNRIVGVIGIVAILHIINKIF